ncbi:MAG: hypothetical protein ACRDP6_37155 [Actinoallomurus sp.]
MSMPFGQPSSGDWFKPAEAYGHLILVTKVHQIGTKFDNLSNGEKPHGVFDMVDLDLPGQPLQQHVNDTHPGIVNKLGKALRTGEMVLGRINQAASDKGNPAWILDAFVPGQDDARAMQWVNSHPMNNFGQPTGPQQNRPAPAPAPQPQQQPYGQQQGQQYAQAPQQQYPPQGGQPQYAPQAAPASPSQQYAPQAPPQQYGPPAQAAASAPQPQQQYAAPAPAAGPSMDPNNPSPEVQALLQQIAQNGGQLPAAPPQA